MTDLRVHLDRLLDLLRQGRVPEWRALGFVFLSNTEVDQGGRLLIRRAGIRSYEQFESEWTELLKQNYAWINLSCLGLDGSMLLVSIETPKQCGSAPRTSVNISGATAGVVANGWQAATQVTFI